MRLFQAIDAKSANVPRARNLVFRQRVRQELLSDMLGEDSRVVCRIIHLKKAESQSGSKKKGAFQKPVGKGNRAPYHVITYVADTEGNVAFVVATDITIAKRQFAVNFLKNLSSDDQIGIGDWIVMFEASQGKATKRGELKIDYQDSFLRVPSAVQPETPIRYETSADIITYVGVQQPRFLFQKATVVHACAGHMCDGQIFGDETGVRSTDPCVGGAQKGVKTVTLQGEILIPDLDMRVTMRSNRLRDMFFSANEWRQMSTDVDAMRDVIKQKIDAWAAAGPTTVVGWVKPATATEDDEENLVSATRCHIVAVIPPTLPVPVANQ